MDPPSGSATCVPILGVDAAEVAPFKGSGDPTEWTTTGGSDNVRTDRSSFQTIGEPSSFNASPSGGLDIDMVTGSSD